MYSYTNFLFVVFVNYFSSHLLSIFFVQCEFFLIECEIFSFNVLQKIIFTFQLFLSYFKRIHWLHTVMSQNCYFPLMVSFIFTFISALGFAQNWNSCILWAQGSGFRNFFILISKGSRIGYWKENHFLTAWQCNLYYKSKWLFMRQSLSGLFFLYC